MAQCLPKPGTITTPVEDGYFRPYKLDITSMSTENCELDATVVDVKKTYEDAPCGHCEAGNIMKFNAD